MTRRADLTQSATWPGAVAETARQVLVHWYSGLVNGRAADYLGALAWETLPFTEPASTEIGFSKWDDVP